jgi:hypothetical protein
MGKNNVFNPKRFCQLLRNDIFKQYRTILVSAGAIVGVLLAIILLSHNSSQYWNFHEVFYPLVLFIGGFIITSLSFTDLHHPQKSYIFLTLPCSIFEKFISKLFLTSIGYIIGSSLLYYLFSVIARGVSNLLFGEAFMLFNPFDQTIIHSMKVYLVTQSIIFFGAVYFKKNHLVKTIFSVFLFSIIMSLFTGLIIRIVFEPYFEITHFEFFSNAGFNHQLESFFENFVKAIEIFFWWIMTPYFWIVSFLRLKETEV